MAKGVMSRSGSVSCTQPERDGGNSSRDQDIGRPGSPAPEALESGRINRSKKVRPRPRDSPGSLHKWKPPFQQGGKQAHTAKARTRKPRPGEQKKKNGTFLNLNAFRRVKAVTTGGTENGPKKEERHDRDDSAYDQENSQARFCQLDTTVARRNRLVKSRRGPRQALRGRGKRRPAQARRIHHAKESLEEARSNRTEILADAHGIEGTRVAAACLS